MAQGYRFRIVVAVLQLVCGLALVTVKLVWDTPFTSTDDWLPFTLWVLVSIFAALQIAGLVREQRRSSQVEKPGS